MTTKGDDGTVIYDVTPLLLDGRPFVANGRLYVSPRRVPSFIVASTNERRDMYVMPVWSKKDTDELMTLELIVVREVVSARVNGFTVGDSFVRSLVVVGRSSAKDPKEINVLEIPQIYKELFDDLFPTGSALSEASEMAYAILSGYNQRYPLVADKRNEQNPSDCKEEGESLGAPAADGVHVENETELPEEKDEKAAMDREHGDENDSHKQENETKENQDETELPTGKREGSSVKRKREDDECASQPEMKRRRLGETELLEDEPVDSQEQMSETEFKSLLTKFIKDEMSAQARALGKK